MMFLKGLVSPAVTIPAHQLLHVRGGNRGNPSPRSD